MRVAQLRHREEAPPGVAEQRPLRERVVDHAQLGVRERRAFSADPSARAIPPESRLVAPTWTAGAYFDALGIPLVKGRFFTDADGPGAERVAIVNDRLARLLWPEVDPIGRRIRWGIDSPQNRSPWMTVVGVVGNVKQAGLDTPAMAQVSVDYLATTTFARRPLLWLQTMAENGGTVAFSPTFGYELCLRRAAKVEPGQYDLSRWRIAGFSSRSRAVRRGSRSRRRG